ncbi:MAG TPA: diguanylate cyclase [Mycobacteriales bacterium]|nr:diguanylate cyclase [Mycobacteriales bacterium]
MGDDDAGQPRNGSSQGGPPHGSQPENGRALDNPTTDHARLVSLLDQAERLFDEHDPAAGIDPARDAVELARLLGDGPLTARALALLGGHHRLAGDAGRAVPLLTEGADLADKYAVPPVQAACLTNLGYLALMAGDLTEATAYLERALVIQRSVGNVVGEAAVLDYLAFTLYEEGEQGQAEDLLDRAHRIRQEHGDPRWIAVSLNNKGYLASLLAARVGVGPDRVARYRQRAVDLLTDAVDHALRCDHRELRSFVTANLAAARVAQGVDEPSPAVFAGRLAAARRTGDRPEEALALFNLGRAHFLAGNRATAELLWAEAVELANELGQSRLLRDIHRDIACDYEEAGEATSALEHYKRFHELERTVAAEAAAQRARLAMVRLEAEHARHETERYRQLNAELAEANRRLKEQALLMDRVSREDELTGLGNRRYLAARLPLAYEHALRTGEPLAVLVADVDLFKEINDRYSHGVGDAVLRSVAQLLSAATRPGDLVIRYGGEEFVLVLANTDVAGARSLAERLRALVEDHDWDVIRPGLRATISLGVCADTGLGSGPRMIDVADQRMYDAKRAGRNRVR